MTQIEAALPPILIYDRALSDPNIRNGTSSADADGRAVLTYGEGDADVIIPIVKAIGPGKETCDAAQKIVNKLPTPLNQEIWRATGCCNLPEYSSNEFCKEPPPTTTPTTTIPTTTSTTLPSTISEFHGEATTAIVRTNPKKPNVGRITLKIKDHEAQLWRDQLFGSGRNNAGSLVLSGCAEPALPDEFVAVSDWITATMSETQPGKTRKYAGDGLKARVTKSGVITVKGTQAGFRLTRDDNDTFVRYFLRLDHSEKPGVYCIEVADGKVKSLVFKAEHKLSRPPASCGFIEHCPPDLPSSISGAFAGINGLQIRAIKRIVTGSDQ